MKCPYCYSRQTKVIDTRPAEDEKIVRRRREYLDCGRRFNSFEYSEFHPAAKWQRRA